MSRVPTRYDVRPKCPTCGRSNVRPTGRSATKKGVIKVPARCDDCGHTWETKSGVLIREADLGRVGA